MSIRIIKKKAKELREKFNSQGKDFVDLKPILKGLGVEIIEESLDDDVSGVLVIKNSKPFIFVNKNQVCQQERTRFTIAHELGHLVFHHSVLNVLKSQLDLPAVMFRDGNSSTGEHRKEIEANQFAAELLMPKELIDDFMQEKNVSFFNEKLIDDLAKKLKVSIQAISIRLTRLGYV